MIVEAIRIFVILAVGGVTALTLREITEDMQHHWETQALG